LKNFSILEELCSIILMIFVLIICLRTI